MQKQRKEVQFYCDVIDQTDPVNLKRRVEKQLHLIGLDLFDKQFRGQAMAAYRNWYPAMPCEVGLNFFLTPVKKREMINCSDLLKFSVKKFWGEKNIFLNLHSAFEVLMQHKREIRKKCGKVVFFFIDAKRDINRVLLVAEERSRWSIHWDSLGITDVVWDDFGNSDIFLLTSDSIPHLFSYLIPLSMSTFYSPTIPRE